MLASDCSGESTVFERRGAMNTDNTQDYTGAYHLTGDLTVHAVLVEVVEEVSLLRLVDAGQHVLRVQQCPDYAHQLHSSAHV